MILAIGGNVSREIKVGDLVRVVHKTTCCNREGMTTYVGRLFVVKVLAKTFIAFCAQCGADMSDIWYADDGSGNLNCELSRLRRIDPLFEPETTQKEMTA